MTLYKIFETNSFRKNIKKIFPPSQEKVFLDRLQARIYPQLRKEPRFGAQIRKLRDYTPPTWRYRLGDLRLFYLIDDEKNVVVVTDLRYRKDAYR